MNRIDKHQYYLGIADSVSERSTCLRRRYGAVIVREDEIISTGYNGAPRGRQNCTDIGRCVREEMQIPSGERYELCRSVHAEANAIISASRRDMIGSTLYLIGRDSRGGLLPVAGCCSMCRRMILNAGISKVVAHVTGGYREFLVRDWIMFDESMPRKKDCVEKEDVI